MTTAEVLGEALPTAQGLGGGAALYWDESSSAQKIYVDRQFFASFEEQVASLRNSKTVYLGNLSFYTTEAQIYELCSHVGPVKRVIMGLNRHTKTPCGFCFVEHFTAEAALENVGKITGLMLDDRVLRAELDFGFREGRQFGRGMTGGQVRDDRRVVYDAARELVDKPAATSSEAIVAAGKDEARDEARKRRFAVTGAKAAAAAPMEEENGDEEEPAAWSKKRRRGDDDDDDDHDGSDEDD